MAAYATGHASKALCGTWVELRTASGRPIPFGTLRDEGREVDQRVIRLEKANMFLERTCNTKRRSAQGKLVDRRQERKGEKLKGPAF